MSFFQFVMAVVTIVPFFGLLYKPMAHSYRYATFMSGWSASTLFWVYWLLGTLDTVEYLISVGVTLFFPLLWFFRTKMRPPKC